MEVALVTLAMLVFSFVAGTDTALVEMLFNFFE